MNMGGPRMAPDSLAEEGYAPSDSPGPNARHAPAKPWRASIPREVSVGA
jgi:hypothetical protein